MSRLHKSLTKALGSALKEATGCIGHDDGASSCPVQTGVKSKFGRALDKVRRTVERCQGADGTVGVIEGSLTRLCNSAVTDAESLIRCADRTARCGACQATNVMFGQAQDCVSFSADPACDGSFSTAVPGTPVVTNAGDDTVTYYGDGASYRFGTFEASTFATDAHPSAVAINPRTDLAYVAARDADVVTLLDASSGQPLAGDVASSGVAVGRAPSAVTVGVDLGIVYVANAEDGTVTMLDAVDGRYVYGSLIGSTRTVGRRPVALALSSDESVLCVANYDDDTVVLLDALSGSPLLGSLAASTFPVGDGPRAVVSDPDRGEFVVASELDSMLVHLDARTGARAFDEPIAVGASPTGATFLSDSIYVAHRGENTIAGVGRRGPLAFVATGTTPSDVASLSTGPLYVLEEGDEALAIASAGDRLAASSVMLKAEPRDMAVDADNGLVFVALRDPYGVLVLGADDGRPAFGSTMDSTIQTERFTDRVAVSDGLLYVGHTALTIRDAATGDYANGTFENSTFPIFDGSHTTLDIEIDPARDLVLVAANPSFQTDVLVSLDRRGAPRFGSLAESTVTIPYPIRDVALHRGLGRAYVATTQGVLYLDSTTNAPIGGSLELATAAESRRLTQLAVDEERELIYGLYGDSVFVLDASTDSPSASSTVREILHIGAPTSAIAYAAVIDVLLVASEGSRPGRTQGELLYVNPTTGERLDALSIGEDPLAIVVNDDDGIIYVATAERDAQRTVTYADLGVPAKYALSGVGTTGIERSIARLAWKNTDVTIDPNLGVAFVGYGTVPTRFMSDAPVPIDRIDRDLAEATSGSDAGRRVVRNVRTGRLFVRNGPGPREYDPRRPNSLDIVEPLLPMSGGLATSAVFDRVYGVDAGNDAVLTTTAETLEYLHGDRASSSEVVGAYPRAIDVDEAVGIVFVANADDDSVTLLSAFDGKHAFGTLHTSTFPVCEEPRAIEVNETEGLVYVSCPDSIIYLDSATGTPAFGSPEASTIRFPHEVELMDADPGYGVLYVGGGDSGVVVALDAALPLPWRGSLAESTLEVGSNVEDLEVDPGSHRVLVVATDAYFAFVRGIVYLAPFLDGFAFPTVAAFDRLATGTSPSDVAVVPNL